MAGVLALINAARLERGQSPLGFANPWLYTISTLSGGKGFNRVVGVSNGYPPLPAAAGGKNGSLGWDPITGLGSPNVEELLKLDANLCP